jgi:tRNA dimethylallyltransferase
MTPRPHLSESARESALSQDEPDLRTRFAGFQRSAGDQDLSDRNAHDVKGRHLALVGPTASGKTSLALSLARLRPDAEIVSVDSMAVYRGMDIGTAKPSVAERAGLRVHMIDLVEPSCDFTVSEFQAAARRVVSEIEQRGRRALLVGGTGLYLRSVIDDLQIPGRWPEIVAQLEAEAEAADAADAADAAQSAGMLHARLMKLDPVAASRIEPSNRRRLLRALEVTIGSGVPFSSYGPGLGSYPRSAFVQVGIPYDQPVHDERVASRFSALVDAGLLDEVRELAARPGGISRTARQAIGYRELLDLLDHLENVESPENPENPENPEYGAALEVALQSAVQRTRSLARRQWSWFRRDPRIEWLDPARDLLEQLLERWDAAGRAERIPAKSMPVGD